MANTTELRQANPSRDYDVVVIGAGVSGLYQLYRLRQAGFRVRVFEQGGDVGGTWYWNRYPGARFDSESYTYGYSFSDELLAEWEWSEHFAAQPETLRYLNFVADKFHLRSDVQFNSRVLSAVWDDASRGWTLSIEGGAKVTSRFLITAIGALSTPTLPKIEGMERFRGQAFHTAQWPHEPLDFRGRRVAVIGTGATGVQVIQEIAKSAAQLTVFQRQPNWCAPLHNKPIDAQTQAWLKRNVKDLIAKCNETYAGFFHVPDRRNAVEVDAHTREALFEKLYGEPGFGIWLANFRDVLLDEKANALLSDFIARKIRERVHDPVTANKLIPTTHGFGTRRVPLESGYYEVYNQPNVRLIDLKETPITRITESGVCTSAGEIEVDFIVYATGFDAVLGGYERMEIRGTGGQTLSAKWRDGPRTFLGLLHQGFPNLLTLVGPHNAATFCNMPRCIEQNVDWVTALLRYMQNHGNTRLEPTLAQEDEWTQHVYDGAARMLFTKVDSWFMGVNHNAGKRTRRFLLYANGLPTYRKRCDELAASGYSGLLLN